MENHDITEEDSKRSTGGQRDQKKKRQNGSRNSDLSVMNVNANRLNSPVKTHTVAE